MADSNYARPGGYWLPDPQADLFEALRDIGHSHVGSEFVASLLEDDLDDVKREPPGAAGAES